MPPLDPPGTTRVLPILLRFGDRLTDETGEYEIIGHPYTTNAGKDVHVRVMRVDNAEVTIARGWGAHERISVKQDAVDSEPGVPEAGVVHFEITASCAKRILAVRRALAAPAQDSSQRRARWCTSGRASSNRTSMAGLPSWRMVNLAPSPAMYTGECWGAWARASFIAPAIVRSVPSDVQVGQLISNAILSTLLIFMSAEAARSASGRLNSTLTCDHASALQRVCGTRRTRLMRARGAKGGLR